MGTKVRPRKHHSTLAKAAKSNRRKPKTKIDFSAPSATAQDPRCLRLRQSLFWAVTEAKKRGDRSLLNDLCAFAGELSAFAKSKSDSLFEFLSRQAGRKATSPNRNLIDLLARVKIESDGSLEDIKTTDGIPADRAKQRYVEIIRMCQRLVRDLENNPSDASAVEGIARKHGFRFAYDDLKQDLDMWPLFQKARRIGIRYSGTTHLGRDKFGKAVWHRPRT